MFYWALIFKGDLGTCKKKMQVAEEQKYTLEYEKKIEHEIKL